MYLGNSIDESEPKGIMLAAMLVPRMLTVHPAAARKTAKRVELLQYLVKMASSKSHWFHNCKFQLLLMAAVDRIPRAAESVTAIGFVNSCDHMAPDFVLLQRAISG